MDWDLYVCLWIHRLSRLAPHHCFHTRPIIFVTAIGPYRKMTLLFWEFNNPTPRPSNLQYTQSHLNCSVLCSSYLTIADPPPPWQALYTGLPLDGSSPWPPGALSPLHPGRDEAHWSSSNAGGGGWVMRGPRQAPSRPPSASALMSWVLRGRPHC